MGPVVPAPTEATYFRDARGGVRSLRVRRHDEDGLVVLSLWQGTLCTGSFRLPVEEVPGLVAALRAGLEAQENGTAD